MFLVCPIPVGPGASNLVTGVADANMDRAPMIVLTGQADTERLHKESHQNMDVLGACARCPLPCRAELLLRR